MGGYRLDPTVLPNAGALGDGEHGAPPPRPKCTGWLFPHPPHYRYPFLIVDLKDQFSSLLPSDPFYRSDLLHSPMSCFPPLLVEEGD